jgi:replication factor C small subunit
MERMIEILLKEEIDFDPELIEEYVNASFPDLRKCINLLDQFSKGGKLYPLTDATSDTLDYMDSFVEYFKQGNFRRAREIICSKAKVEEYDQIYRYFYTHLDLFSDTDEGQMEAVVKIAEGLRGHALAADPEINLAAVVINLSRV